MFNKKLVHYYAVAFQTPRQGRSILVEPIDHPDTAHVSNKGPALTSRIVHVGETPGEFETENTYYVRVTKRINIASGEDVCVSS